jgi:outer membrane protein TolC
MKNIVLIFIFCSVQLLGQTLAPDGLKTLVNASFTFAPRLAELETQSEMQGQRTQFMSSYLLPSVNAFGTYNYITPVGQIPFPSGPNEVMNIRFQPNNNVNIGLNASYTILDFGRAKANIDRSKMELASSKLSIESAKNQIAAQVAQTFFTLAFLQESIRIEDSLITTLDENFSVTQKRVQQGDALQLDLMNLQSSIDLEKNRRLELQSAFEKQTLLLEYICGKSPAKNELRLDFKSDDSAEALALLQLSESQNPEFALIKSKKEATRLDAFQLERSYLPTLSINAGTGFRNAYQPDIYEMRYNYAFGFSLNAPLYQGGRSRIQKKINGSLLKLNDLAYDNLQKTTKRDLMQAQTELASLKNRLANASNMVENAREAVRVGKVRYTNGTASHTDYMNAISNLQRVQLTLVNYTYQLCLTRIEIARLSGNRWW